MSDRPVRGLRREVLGEEREEFGGDLGYVAVVEAVPWLLDTLETGEDSSVFETYVWQDSVLLAPVEARQRRRRTLPGRGPGYRASR
ncbi:hypothetical protein [Streptomyces niveus]|uniref:hypothetical protein n=1 Tax=Streptomyces niveus TaxID=193462 RepID=UPI00343DAACE